jgi:hypothetical protein
MREHANYSFYSACPQNFDQDENKISAKQKIPPKLSITLVSGLKIARGALYMHLACSNWPGA